LEVAVNRFPAPGFFHESVDAWHERAAPALVLLSADW
jgi:hypothetical protein